MEFLTIHPFWNNYIEFYHIINNLIEVKMEIVNTYLNVDNMIKSNPLILKINGLDFCNFMMELS